MMFSIKLQTLIHFLQQKKQEQITRRLNHNFKNGKTLRRSVLSTHYNEPVKGANMQPDNLPN